MRKQIPHKVSSIYLFRFHLILTLFLLMSVALNAAVSIACFEQVNIALDADGEAMILPESVVEIAGDPAELDFITVTPNFFDCSDIGPTTAIVNWSIDGVTESCFVNLLIQDKIFPSSIACFATVNVSLDADGVVELTEEMLLFSFEDNCTYSVVFSPSTVSCADIGTPVNVVVTVTDAGGNSNSCFSTVIVEDKINPGTIACDAAVNISLDADGFVELTGDMFLVAAEDNCNLTTTVVPSSVSCADIGTPVTVVVTVTDPGGNSNSCFTTVTVEDKLNPLVICEADIILDLAGNSSASISPADVDAGSFDNCSIASMSLDQSVFTTVDVGSNTVVLTVLDDSGNSNSCFSNLEVISSVYCDSRGTNTSNEYIKSVKFAGINDNTGDNGGYLDNTAEVGDVIPGNSYTISLKPKFRGDKKTEHWNVWIDWNQNNVFESSENVVSGISDSNISASILVPGSANVGVTRMRISMKRSGFAEACETFARGEVEDYTVNVLPPAPPRMRNPSMGDPARLSTVQHIDTKMSSSEVSKSGLFPNPAKNHLSLDISQFKNVEQVEVYNILGEKLQRVSSTQEDNILTLDINTLNEGTFMLVVETDEGVKVFPFVKLK